ncbi:MAG TPA: phosphoribosylglycinamide formyltransferase [Gammaproteobacteria bacterium]|nr:phosphoribosylglycinamide formyltransferase [Gammaproteobacteria bacterium]
MSPTKAVPLPIVVLISGNGTNLQALIDARQRGELPVDIKTVISNRPGAPGLERARRAGIPTAVIDHKHYPDRDSFDRALQQEIDRHHPALVVLAGFMRILTPAFVNHYRGRMLNIHPSLLPAFRGLNTHQRALEAGVSKHGASVHFVTSELDGGPVVAQRKVPVHPDDDAVTLSARVQQVEHKLYPEVIRWFAEGRLELRGTQVFLNGQLLQ